MVGQQPRPFHQMKLVVDTNIVFSVLLNSNGSIGDLLFNSGQQFEFYSCGYMRQEIRKHWAKLKGISRLSEDQLQTAYALVLGRLNFIDEALIPAAAWAEAAHLTQDIDPDDTAFVALANWLQAALWTGDKVLYNGLKQHGSAPGTERRRVAGNQDNRAG